MTVAIREQDKALSASRPIPDLREIEAFIHNEARLLDDRRFEEWMELFAEDGVYWAPTVPGQESPHRLPSLFYDDRGAMKARISRLRHPRIYVQMPPSRTRHLITGIRIDAIDESAGECDASSSFLMLEYRQGYDQRLFGGQFQHKIRFSGERLLIVLQRAELINCDDSFRAMAIPF
jgi:3-phenylpropionate/cinnamic acid dioxygenase small subunit